MAGELNALAKELRDAKARQRKIADACDALDKQLDELGEKLEAAQEAEKGAKAHGKEEGNDDDPFAL
jgi:predicted transcriptional regulator